MALMHQLVHYRPTTQPLQPFLEFMSQSILVPFNSRSYRDPGEKWLVVVGVLRIFHHVLEMYYPDPHEAPQAGVAPGGEELVLILLNESPALSLQAMFTVLAFGQHYTLKDTPGAATTVETLKPEHEHALKESVLLVLKIFDMLFEKQGVLLAYELIQDRIEDVIVDMDPVTRRSERVASLTRFLALEFDAELALHAMRILWSLSRSEATQVGVMCLLFRKESGGEGRELFKLSTRFSRLYLGVNLLTLALFCFLFHFLSV